MRFSLGTTVSKVAAVIGVATRAATYVRNNLKIYFDFKSTRAKTLEFVGTGSVNFDGTSDSLKYDAAIGSGASTYSVSMWVRRDSDAQAMYLLDARGDSNDGGTGYFYVSGGGTVINKSSGTAYVDGVASTTVTLNKWHHVVLSGISLNINEDLQIGEQWQVGQYEWDGNICQIGLWNRTLSVSEIQNIMHKTYDDLVGTEKTHLVSWWALDSSSDTYNDSHGTNHLDNTNTVLQDGIYGDYSPKKPRGFDNAPTAQADLIGSGSASFTASNEDYITMGNVGNLGSTTDFTIAGWMKATDFSSKRVLLSKWQEDANRWYFGTDGSDQINFYSKAGGSGAIGLTGTDAVTDNQWHHLAISCDRDGTENAYVDGVLNASANCATTDIDNTGDLRIGAGGTGASLNEFMDGNIAQVGLWQRALSQEEIQSIKEKSYSELSTSEKTNLVSWWGLDSILYGTNSNVSPASGTSYDTGYIMEDKKGSLTTVLEDNITSLDNWESADSNGTIEINGDGNLLITADGGTATLRLKSSVVTLETDTKYIAELGIAGGTDASANIRLDDSAYGGVQYGNGYTDTREGSNADPCHFAVKFTSDGTNTGFYMYLTGVGDGTTAIVSSFKLYKITSGNYGVAN